MADDLTPRPECDCDGATDVYGVHWHRSSCASVAWIRELQKRLLPELIEMDRVRRRGAAEARNYVIG